MAKIKILRQTSIAGEPKFVGKTYDVADSDARILVQNRQAEEVKPEPVKAQENSKSKAKAEAEAKA